LSLSWLFGEPPFAAGNAPAIAKTGLSYPETAALKSTRPTGSGDPAQTLEDTETLVLL
jgi:hypothetical protein